MTAMITANVQPKHARRAPSSSLATEAAQAAAALHALHAETKRVAAATTAAATIAVHLTRSGSEASAQFSTALMRPAFSPAASLHVAALRRGEDRTELAQAWHLLLADLASANRLSGEARNGVVTSAMVRDGWQRCCRTLLEWFALLQPLMLESGSVSDTAHDAPALAMLRRAAAGETPALEANGPFALPSGSERRRELRHDVSIPVTLIAGSMRCPARLANISTRGVLAFADRQIPSGRPIKIELAGGRCFDGHVCWSNVRQLGVTLAAPLAADDALWTDVLV